ncbi:MAG TPA: hypothetical protein ENH82_08405 [bacterium]|nr:hypothetical protein [bacterium]
MTFQPPTIEEVEAYGKLRNLTVNPQKFLMHYEDSDPPWTNKESEPIKNWKLTMQSWHFNNMSRADTHRCSCCSNYGVYVYKDDTGLPYWRCIDHKLKQKPIVTKEQAGRILKMVPDKDTRSTSDKKNKQMEELAKKVHG